MFSSLLSIDWKLSDRKMKNGYKQDDKGDVVFSNLLGKPRTRK